VAAVVAASCATDAPDRPTENPDAVAAASPPAAVDPGSGPMLDLETALSLAAMPLSCVDRPHALRPDRAGYLDDISYTRRRDFDRSRAFYGCWDWHSAVNSTWAMVRLVKEVPGLPVAPLIREKLRDHLSEEALAGEQPRRGRGAVELDQGGEDPAAVHDLHRARPVVAPLGGQREVGRMHHNQRSSR